MVTRNPLTGAIQPFQSALPMGVTTNGLPQPPMGSAQFQFGRPNQLTQTGLPDPNAPFVSRQPQPQPQPQQVVPVTAPAKPTDPMAQGLLSNNAPVQDGLLGASAAALSLGGNTRTPTSMGQVIGKALQGYRSGELAGVKRQRAEGEYARQQQMIDKYGPGYDIPGVAQAQIEGQVAAQGAQRLEAMMNPQGPGPQGPGSQGLVAQGALPGGNAQTAQPVDEVFNHSMGFVMTPARQSELRFAQQKGPSKLADTIKGFQSDDRTASNDARTRIQKPFTALRLVSVQHNKVQKSLMRKDGPGDLTGVTSIQKMIDGGIVRKEDMDNWARTIGLADTWSALFQRAADGQLLKNKTRIALKGLSTTLYNAEQSSFADFIGIQKELAFQNNVPWRRVFGPLAQKYMDPVATSGGSTGGNGGQGNGEVEVDLAAAPAGTTL